jgi:hypothetical protein
MKIRTQHLEWAIKRLPEPTEDGPPTMAIPLPLETMMADQPPKRDAVITAPRGHYLRFKRERYGHGNKHWYEWTLDVSDSA